ncbi:MAG TPA: SGNH/GDSL hydrolase family protein [Jatrophihabitans sp.]|nr:SGNH/GDSL hydrolase family protein [Jatrophihabitans sp.]
MKRNWKAPALAAAVTLAGTSVLLSGAGVSALASTSGNSQGNSGHARWANTWMAAVTHGDSAGSTHNGLNDQSVRLIVHTTIGGSQVRVRLTNQHGDQAVTVGHATVAKPDLSTANEADIVPSTLKELRFNGQPSAVMQKGATLLSDPVSLPVGSQQNLVVSVYFPTPTGPTTFHSTSNQTNFVGPTDLADQVSGAGYTTTRTCCWFFLSGVDVTARDAAGPVVVFGDSIADGNGSTLDANHRWPNLLYARLASAEGDDAPAVLDAGLAGNRLNHDGTEPGAGGFPGFDELGSNAPARLNDDVFGETNPRTVITDLGINDIWMSDDSAAAIIATLRQLNQQIKERGLRSLVATLGPFQGLAPFDDTDPNLVWTPEKEATRQAVNDYLRHSTEFDGVIDFDKVIRDPANPAQLRPSLDSGDHIHPNDTGYQLMVNAIPLRLLSDR